MSNARARATSFLAGESITFLEADRLWKDLKKENDIGAARAVLARLRKDQGLLDGLPADQTVPSELCRQHALLTSKDPELSAATRHDQAIKILRERFNIDPATAAADAETCGIAAGIYKRRWYELGQLRDLHLAGQLYERGAQAPMGTDAYPHINAAFTEDLLAYAGDAPLARPERADQIRRRILAELPVLPDQWFNVATRAEALFGLGRYVEAREVITGALRPPLWQLETTARQLATLAHIRVTGDPLDNKDVSDFFNTLLSGAAAAVRSAFIGKVGLALSGGGFRASFYHLGVLARLAELDVLRHVDVLSCVSGGSIVGACYWLALRKRLLEGAPLDRSAYVDLVAALIDHVEQAVAADLRHGIQPWKATVLFKVLLDDAQGALDPERVATFLDDKFYRPLVAADAPSLDMHHLTFTPKDHDAAVTGSDRFNPVQHNWLRRDKVPVLGLEDFAGPRRRGVRLRAGRVRAGRDEDRLRRRSRGAARRRRRLRQPGYRRAACAQLQRVDRQRCVRSAAARAARDLRCERAPVVREPIDERADGARPAGELR
jgi:hypothetical protein